MDLLAVTFLATVMSSAFSILFVKKIAVKYLEDIDSYTKEYMKKIEDAVSMAISKRK